MMVWLLVLVVGMVFLRCGLKFEEAVLFYSRLYILLSEFMSVYFEDGEYNSVVV